MQIRAYTPTDCREITQLFYDTVHLVNAVDYSPEQVQAWAPGATDLTRWNQSFLDHHTLIATEEGRIIGFGDIDETGYLDRLYVHHQHIGQGVGTTLASLLEQYALTRGVSILTTQASITAQPFFLHMGYEVICSQTVICRNVPLSNFLMQKTCMAHIY